MRFLIASTVNRYGWLLPALMLVSLPMSGGPRPIFWLSAGLGLLAMTLARAVLRGAAARQLALLWSCLAVPVLCSLPGSFDALGTTKVFGVLVSALPAGLLWIGTLQSHNSQKMLERTVLLLVSLWCLDGCWQALSGVDLFGVPLSEDGRVVGPFDGNLRFPVLLPILLSSAVCALGLRGRSTSAVCLWVLGAAVTLMGGTRAQYVTLALSAAMILPILPGSDRRRLAVVAFTLLAGWAIVRLASGREWTLAIDFGALPRTAEGWFATIDTLSSSRLSSWRAAFEMGMSNFFGVGASSFTEAYHRFTAPGDTRVALAGTGTEINHAHHVWFAVFAESGAFGILGLIGAFAILSGQWHRAAKTARDAARPYGIALSMYFFPVALHPPLYLFWLFPVIWLLICAYLAALTGETSGEVK